MTIRLCRACREWHDPDAWPAACLPEATAKRGAFPTPMVSGDALARPLESMATGRWHDSKSTLRREYRERGFVEIGTDRNRAPAPAPADHRPAIARALKKHGLL